MGFGHHPRWNEVDDDRLTRVIRLMIRACGVYAQSIMLCMMLCSISICVPLVWFCMGLSDCWWVWFAACCCYVMSRSMTHRYRYLEQRHMAVTHALIMQSTLPYAERTVSNEELQQILLFFCAAA